jgi:molybdopterin molybdotransferase
VIPLDEAVAHVLAGCAPLPPVTVPAARAAGLVLADDVVAVEAVPPFANSAMDGYAVRAADVAGAPVELPVVAEVAAGHPAERALGPGEAMRIFTGAPVPDGADAVVMVERTERLDGGTRVRIDAGVDPGTHVRAAGEDLKPGERVLAAGEALTAARLGVLASLGVAEVAAHPRPRVGVV